MFRTLCNDFGSAGQVTETEATPVVMFPTQRSMEAILRELFERDGVVYGARDLATVWAALLRAERMLASTKVSAAQAAAAIGFTLCSSPLPGIADQNLRAAWVAMFVTMRLNGLYLDAREVDATAIVLGVADGSVDESVLIAFLETNSREVP